MDDIDAISTWECDKPSEQRTGPRRDPPAVCYTCGADVPDTPRFGNEATCDECRRAGRSVLKPWLVDVEVPR